MLRGIQVIVFVLQMKYRIWSCIANHIDKDMTFPESHISAVLVVKSIFEK